MAEVTVTIDGKEHKVDESDVTLPEGHKIYSVEALKQTHIPRNEVDANYTHKDQVKARVDSEVTRRFADYVKRDEAAADPMVVSKVLESKGKDQIDLEKAKQAWATENLEPIKQERDTLREAALSGALNQAAISAGFDPKYAKRPDAGTPSYFESVMGSKFEWDPEHKSFVKVEGGNKVTAIEPKNGNPFQGPEEFMAQLAKTEGWKGFLAPEDKNTRGPGYGDTSPGDRGNTGKGTERPDVSASHHEKAQYYLNRAES